LAEIILLEVQKEGTPWAPLTLLLRQDFPSKGKHNRVIIEKPITFLSTYPNWMIKLEMEHLRAPLTKISVIWAPILFWEEIG
jgi:hypothetical protein